MMEEYEVYSSDNDEELVNCAVFADFENYKVEKNGRQAPEGSRMRPTVSELEKMCTSNPYHFPFHPTADRYRKLRHRTSKAYVRIMLRFERDVEGLVVGEKILGGVKVPASRRGTAIARILTSYMVVRSKRILDVHINFIPYDEWFDNLVTRMLNSLSNCKLDPQGLSLKMKDYFREHGDGPEPNYCQVVSGLFLADDRNPTRDTMLGRDVVWGTLYYMREINGFKMSAEELGGCTGHTLISDGLRHINRVWPRYRIRREGENFYFDNFDNEKEAEVLQLDYWEVVTLETLSRL